MSKKLIFVHNADFSKPIGNKSQVISMCNAFAENGLEVTLLGTKSQDFKIGDLYELNSKVKCIFINTNMNYYTRTLLLLSKYRKIKNQFNYTFTRDLIFTYLVNIKNIFYELHNIYEKPIWLYFLKRVFSKTSHMIVISGGLKEGLIEKGFEKNKIVVLHDSVNHKKFDIKLSKEEARKKLKINSKEFIISYVGNTEKIRDLPNLIEVCKDLDLELHIYGKDQDYLFEASKKYKNIYFNGYTNKPEIIYKASDCLFAGFTNKIETINYMSPLKLFEYLASKRPIIVSDFPRIREVVSENEVFLYEAENRRDLKKQILEVMKNKKLSEKRTKAAFEKSKEYTWKNRAKQILKLYKND